MARAAAAAAAAASDGAYDVLVLVRRCRVLMLVLLLMGQVSECRIQEQVLRTVAGVHLVAAMVVNVVVVVVATGRGVAS